MPERSWRLLVWPILATAAVAGALVIGRPARDWVVAPTDPATLLSERSALAAACRDTAAWVERQLGSGARTVVHVPLVLAGDLDDDALDRWYRQAIEPGMKFLAAEYFDTSPSQPITILLFRDRESYRDHARRLFGAAPPSPYGFYRDHLRVVVVNTQAGPGALFHELSHSLMAFDFPTAPVWLSEGLAALYEDGSLEPLGPGGKVAASRRLPILLDAFRRGEIPSLQVLLHTSDFEGPRQALCYAQAQQFCRFLAAQGLLREAYQRVRDGHTHDPSGEEAVHGVLTGRPWAEIDADFRRYLSQQTTASPAPVSPQSR